MGTHAKPECRCWPKRNSYTFKAYSKVRYVESSNLGLTASIVPQGARPDNDNQQLYIAGSPR